MIETIYIAEMTEGKEEVVFTASVNFNGEEKQTLEDPGCPEHFEVDEITWDKTLYSDEENWIIEDSLEEVATQFEFMAKNLKKDREEERLENMYANRM